MTTAYQQARLQNGFVDLSEEEKASHMAKISSLLKSAVQEGVQEITIVSGEPIDFKSKGVLERKLELPIWDDDDFNYFLTTLTYQTTESRPHITSKNRMDTEFFETLMEDKGYSFDFAVNLQGKTLRIHAVSIYNPQGRVRKEKYCFTIRVVPTEIPDWDDLNLPRVFKRVEVLKSGLVLVSGHTGSGKSTTVATIVKNINRNPNTRKTILTIEEPIEFVHKSENARILQRCVGINVPSYNKATNDALRENVDVVVIGELREPEEMDNAIRLAEIGKLVIATVHSNSPADTIDRIVNSFPGDVQENVRARLSENIVGIIHQNLEVIDNTQYPVASGFIIENANNKSKMRKSFDRSGLTNMIKTEQKTWAMTHEDSFEELVERKVIEDTPENRRILIPVV